MIPCAFADVRYSSVVLSGTNFSSVKYSKGDFPFPPCHQHTGSVKGRMANNNPAIGIMGIADMFLIGFIFGHGKSLLITHQQGQAGLSTAGVAHSLAVDWFGWVCYF